MLTPSGHLTYCTNIHTGESWSDHFHALKENFPYIRQNTSPEVPAGIGLRLSHQASLDLFEKNQLQLFRDWLEEENAYVFTMNGFPYGGFHHTRVKDQVHAPDWTTEERVQYTHRLFHLLAMLLPEGMEGGISTSPLSYKPWFPDKISLQAARSRATENILRIIVKLIEIYHGQGVLLHLDIEPEPGGLLETGNEFIEWFEKDLLLKGVPMLENKWGLSPAGAEEMIREHLRLCYDICHFAIGFEPHQDMIKRLSDRGLKIGKVQISAALKARFYQHDNVYFKKIKDAFQQYNEPVYLHQVIEKKKNGTLRVYRDLPQALAQKYNSSIKEWRAHFHVPIFADEFGILESTRDEIQDVLSIQRENPFTGHLEVETYTWEVLPQELKLPLHESITRELNWAKSLLGADVF